MEISEYLHGTPNMRQFNKSKTAADNDHHRNQSELSRANKRGNFILRQELRDYTVECSSKIAIIFNLLLFMLFMMFGVPIVLSSENILVTTVRYDIW
jgi:hypothetical protein